MIKQKTILRGFIGVALMVLVGFVQPAYCQDAGYYSLMIQQSASDAGIVSPPIGIHQAGVNEQVTVRAIPKPGYRFVYWMGDVSDPSASETIVVMDAPKIIVAIFERTEHGLPVRMVDFADRQAPGGGGATGLLTRTAGGVSGGAALAGGGVTPSKKGVATISNDKPDDGGDDDVPVPIPEPATLVLLGAGGLILFARKRY